VIAPRVKRSHIENSYLPFGVFACNRVISVSTSVEATDPVSFACVVGPLSDAAQASSIGTVLPWRKDPASAL